MNENDILLRIKNDPWMMSILQLVAKQQLPDWWIGAGFVRNKIWDFIHNKTQRTPLRDIDVIYFDKKDLTEEYEKDVSKKLSEYMPEINWQVKNQARMHIVHNDPPYKNASEGLSHWVETATCIGVKITDKNQLELTAPLGIDDLVHCIVRPNPTVVFDKKIFLTRVLGKKWLEEWPKLKVFYR